VKADPGEETGKKKSRHKKKELSTSEDSEIDELERAEAENSAPAIPVVWAVAQYWLEDLQKRECLVNLLLEKEVGWGFIRYIIFI
jgi:hypothetical protein